MGFKAIKADPFRGVRELMLSPEEMRLAIERIRAARSIVGDDVEILIECHGFLNAATAIEAGRRLEQYRPLFLEESVPPENIDEMVKVAAAVNVPLATGERLYTRHQFRDLLEKQIVSFIQPDLCHCGGFNEGRKIAAMAEPYHVKVLPHNPNGPISTLVGVHFGACSANFMMLEMIRPDGASRRPDLGNIFENMPTQKDGFLDVPDGPGWGVEFDESLLARFPADHG